jgi:hypothetical protein
MRPKRIGTSSGQPPLVRCGEHFDRIAPPLGWLPSALGLARYRIAQCLSLRAALVRRKNCHLAARHSGRLFVIKLALFIAAFLHWHQG